MATDAEILAAGELNFKSLASVGEAVGKYREKKQEAADAETRKENALKFAGAYGSTTYGQTEQGQMESMGMALGLNDPKDAIARFSGMKPEELAGTFALNMENIKDPKAMEAAKRAIDNFKEYQESMAYFKAKGDALGGNFSYTQQAKMLEASSDSKAMKLVDADPIDGNIISASIKDRFRTDDETSVVSLDKADLFGKDYEGTIEIDPNKSWLETYNELKGEGKGFIGKFFSEPYSEEQLISVKKAYFAQLEDASRDAVLSAAPYLKNPALREYLDAATIQVTKRMAILGADRASREADDKGNFNYNLGKIPEIAYRDPTGRAGGLSDEPISDGWQEAIKKASPDELKEYVFAYPKLTKEMRAKIESDLTGAEVKRVAEILIKGGFKPTGQAAKPPKAPDEVVPVAPSSAPSSWSGSWGGSWSGSWGGSGSWSGSWSRRRRDETPAAIDTAPGAPSGALDSPTKAARKKSFGNRQNTDAEIKAKIKQYKKALA